MVLIQELLKRHDIFYSLICKNRFQTSVILVDKVDDDFYHRILFLGAAFGDHEGEGYEGVVSDALGTVLIIQDAVAIEEPQE